MWNGEDGREVASQPTEFVAKLYGMLENPLYKGIVTWSQNQDSFLILDLGKFQENVIPKEFNHSNFSSFVRQLNKYDFHKQRFPGSSSKIWEFKHKDFVPANKNKAHIIKRKGPGSRNNAALQEAIEDLNEQLLDVYTRMDKLESDNVSLLRMIEQQQNLIRAMSSSAALAHKVEPQLPRILLAMVSGEVRDALANVICELGYHLDCTESGLEALDMVKGQQYSALVLEPILSQISGSEVAEQARADYGPQLPIIMTAGVEDGDLQAKEAYYKDKGADTILWRPFAKSQLVEILHKFIN